MILSIDLGSTSFKAAVLDKELRVRGFFSHEVRHQFASGGKVELAVEEATSAVRKAIREAVASVGIRASKLRAVAVTSQAQTFTLIDKQGRPRMPFISWQDNRAVRSCERLKQTKSMHNFGEHCSFGSLMPPLLICQLKHLRETRPGFVTPDNVVVCLPTFFVHQWCGIAAIDENLVAMSGMYSLALRTWWPAALRVCGLRSRQLPELRPLGRIASHTNAGALEFGLPKGIPVVLAGNDQTAGAYAARLDEDHGLLVTLGTAQAAYAYLDTMPRPHPALIRGPFPDGRFYRMAADSCGGSIINWAKAILAGCETDKKFFNLAAQSPPDCRGLKFEPNCHESRGIWRNIGLDHTSTDFARSVLESLTHRMSELIQQLGVRLDRTQVFVAGGGSENPLWIRILSETLGVRLKVTEGRPVVGAGRMALKTLSDIQR
ncbi:MAG: hypothetical protein HY298_17700 [Verrucomicrobia bacterium]|nr:hypothetical protein [Verrucomicrobiota bacterium]